MCSRFKPLLFELDVQQKSSSPTLPSELQHTSSTKVARTISSSFPMTESEGEVLSRKFSVPGTLSCLQVKESLQLCCDLVPKAELLLQPSLRARRTDRQLMAGLLDPAQPAISGLSVRRGSSQLLPQKHTWAYFTKARSSQSSSFWLVRTKKPSERKRT